MLEIELRVPRWATETGVVRNPKKRETFVHYCLSLGAPYQEIVEGLDERTADLANGRLATWVQRRNREQFRTYTRNWLKSLVPPTRLRELEAIGENIRIGRWS